MIDTCHTCEFMRDPPTANGGYCKMGKNTVIILALFGHCTRYYKPKVKAVGSCEGCALITECGLDRADNPMGYPCPKVPAGGRVL